MKTIVITGPSGSGKTNLAIKLSNDLENCILIKTDSYYRDNFIIKLISFFLNDIYDRLFSIKRKNLLKTINSIYKNKNKIIHYNYDFKRKQSYKKIKKKQNKTDYLIIEGIFSHRLDLNYNNSINILCKEKKEICFQRRLNRDEIERGRNKKEVKIRFINSWNLFYKNYINYLNNNRVYKINTADNQSYAELIDKIKQWKSLG